MLAFEERWAAIESVAGASSAPFRTKLLTPLVVAKLVYRWASGFLGQKWIASLLDKYACQPSTVVRPLLNLLHEGMINANPGSILMCHCHNFVLREENDDKLLQRLYTLATERTLDEHASACDLKEALGPGWYRHELFGLDSPISDIDADGWLSEYEKELRWPSR